MKKLSTVSVMEGETVMLKPDIKVKRGDEILWKFGPQRVSIAEIREGPERYLSLPMGCSKTD